MEFDESRVYTALNADELKVGSKVILSDVLAHLKGYIFNNVKAETLMQVKGEECQDRFVGELGDTYSLAYLISEPEEKKLKWTDLKLGDVIRQKEGTISLLVTGIDVDPSTNVHIFTRDIWVLDSELENWEKVEE